MWVLLAAALLTASGDGCKRNREPLVAKAETAHAIALAVFAEKGIRPGDRAMFGTYVISVVPDPDDRRYWLAAAADDDAVASALIFRINRCDGAIRDMRWVH